MKAHLVFAHPSLVSINGQMRDQALSSLSQLGYTTTVSDLYQMDFKASADQKDFTELYRPSYFDLQVEQSAAAQRGTFVDDIKKEHQFLSQSELIIFQFPLWWYSVPGLLKGYIDRVFSAGWAYGGNSQLYGKKILVSMTTGAPEFAWQNDKRGTIKDIFKHLFVGTFDMCGLQTLPPYVLYGAKGQSAEEFSQRLEEFNLHLQKYCSIK